MKNKISALILSFLMTAQPLLAAQQTSLGKLSVGTPTAVPASSVLEVNSTTKGSRPCPPMTQTQRDAISSPATGLCIFNTTSGKYNNYNGTSWAEMGGGGSGGGGGTQYLTDDSSNFDSTLGSWITYDDGAATQPVNGNVEGGETITTTCTRTTSSPLHGAGSLLITKDAANRQGEGCSVAVTIAAVHSKGTTIYVDADFSIPTGTYATDDISWWAYDVTGNIMYPLLSKSNGTANGMATCASGSYCHFTGYFTTSSGSTSYRLIPHIASTSSSAYTVQIDDVRFAVRDNTVGSTITAWQSYSPTITAVTSNPTVGTNTTTAVWRQVGDSIEIQYRLSQTGAGSAGTGKYLFPFPSGVVADTTRVTATGNTSGIGSTVVGTAYAANTTTVASSVQSLGAAILYDSTHLLIATTRSAVGDYNVVVGSDVLPLSGTTIYYSFEAKFPVVGWSANTTMASSTNNSPTQQRFTSGSGTYITPAGAKYLRVRMVGPGGGGGGAGASGTGGNGGNGGASTNTTFGTSLLTAGYGIGGGAGSSVGGAGGTGAIASPAFGTYFPGGMGGSSGVTTSSASSVYHYLMGGAGGSSCFGGGGAATYYSTTGGSAVANSGGGGAGGAPNAAQSIYGGAGGGAGACIDAFILNPAATYAYVVPAGGTGGTAGTNGSAGGAGSAGYIEVTEYYVPNGTVALDNDMVVSKSSNYTLQPNDRTVIFTADATASLPPAAQVMGRIYRIKTTTSTTDVTVDPNSSETICGVSTILVSGDLDSIDIQSDGSNWIGLNGSCFRTIGRSGNEGGNCTSGTCSSRWVSPMGATMTYVSTGQYAFNIPSGVYSQIPACTSGASRNANTLCAPVGGQTTTVIGLACYTANSGAVANDNPNITCVGQR